MFLRTASFASTIALIGGFIAAATGGSTPKAPSIEDKLRVTAMERLEVVAAKSASPSCQVGAKGLMYSLVHETPSTTFANALVRDAMTFTANCGKRGFHIDSTLEPSSRFNYVDIAANAYPLYANRKGGITPNCSSAMIRFHHAAENVDVKEHGFFGRLMTAIYGPTLSHTKAFLALKDATIRMETHCGDLTLQPGK